jgi:addiction module HigA family antidote
MSRSSTTTSLRNPHPGEILLLEFLAPMGLSQSALARAVGVPPRRVNEIVLGKRAVTADTDLRLTRYFGLSEGFFLRLQADHDLMARRREIGGAADHRPASGLSGDQRRFFAPPPPWIRSDMSPMKSPEPA